MQCSYQLDFQLQIVALIAERLGYARSTRYYFILK